SAPWETRCRRRGRPSTGHRTRERAWRHTDDEERNRSDRRREPAHARDPPRGDGRARGARRHGAAALLVWTPRLARDRHLDGGVRAGLRSHDLAGGVRQGGVGHAAGHGRRHRAAGLGSERSMTLDANIRGGEHRLRHAWGSGTVRLGVLDRYYLAVII